MLTITELDREFDTFYNTGQMYSDFGIRRELSGSNFCTVFSGQPANLWILARASGAGATTGLGPITMRATCQFTYDGPKRLATILIEWQQDHGSSQTQTVTVGYNNTESLEFTLGNLTLKYKLALDLPKVEVMKFI